MKKLVGLISILLFLPHKALAHCPLCTIGAGAAAGVAMWLGVKVIVIGMFLGACALALGLWVSRMIKKQYIPYQEWVIGILSFVTTIFPLQPMFKEYGSLNIYWFGEYGSLFFRTYLIDLFIIGAIVGAIIMLISPRISKEVAKIHDGKIIPFQGVIITFGMLIVLGLFMQFGL